MKQKGLLAILIIVVSIVAMFSWEVWGREKIIYKEILVFNNDIEKNQIIKEDMISVRKVSKVPKNALTQSNIKQVVGMESEHFIPKGCPLFGSFFRKKGLVPKNKEYIFSIPSQWLIAIPQTLRRGDRVFLYKWSEEENEEPKYLFDSIVAFSKDSSNNEVKSKDPSRLEGSGNVTLMEIIINKNQMEKVSNAVKGKNKLLVMYK